MTPQALDGVRVLDLTHHIAGPYCTKLLADFGAEVIKIERPRAGDPARSIGPFFHDLPHSEGSALFLHLNTNKQSLMLNLKSAEGQVIVRRLLETVDIVVENFRPGVLARLGLDFDTVRTLNPQIVLTSISNFGQTGPYRDLKASEIVEYAMGGPMNVTGHGSREPLKLGGNIVQYHAGAVAAYATLVALWSAETEGNGDWIDVSIYETQAASRDRRAIYLTGYAYTGEIAKRHGGSPRPLLGVKPAGEGYINLTGAGTRLSGVLRMIGREDLLADPRLADPRAARQPELLEEVEALYLDWLQDQTKYDAVARAQEQHVLAAPVNTIADLFADPHFQARAPWSSIDHPYTGAISYPGRPFVMSETPQRPPRRAPLLGEHTQALLCDQLGYRREDLRRLAETGVI
jgi:crotonobetainyl-CoA:carnitine CoA-transferase CaiB-like acyl-CoA transferase